MVYVLIIFAVSVTVLLGALFYTMYYQRREYRRASEYVNEKPKRTIPPEPISHAEQPKQQKEQAASPEVPHKSQRGTILPVHKDALYETQNIDAECFAYFKGARVLLVEDNKINQSIIKSILQKSGMILQIANNGEEGLEILESSEEGFDIILMDISMPVMDGIEATRRIRLQKRYDMIPIVTFTAFVGGEEIAQMFAVGSNAFLTKPLNIHQLYTAFKLYIPPKQRYTSLENMLQIEGLDITEGMAWAEGDEKRYRERLEMFVHRYGKMNELVPKWISQKRYERLKAECFSLQSTLGEIGAYEMKAIVDDMIKDFIYHNEHLLSRFTHLFPIVFNTLLQAVQQYLSQRPNETVLPTLQDRSISIEQMHEG